MGGTTRERPPRATQQQPKPLSYPSVRRDESCVDNPGNVPDPYRWLEGSADDADIQAFVKAQNKVTTKYLSQGKKLTQKLTKR